MKHVKIIPLIADYKTYNKSTLYVFCMLLSATPLALNAQVNGMQFKTIPAGSFYKSTRHYKTGKLIRWYKVNLSHSYQIQTTEVTQAQWQKIMAKLPEQYEWYKEMRGDNKPVSFVSYQDVKEFITKLNELDKSARYRLPYEYEWEFIAKKSDQSYFYWGSNKMSKRYAVFQKSGAKNPQKVATRKPNRYGVYDLWGNVWEWTATTNDTRNRDFHNGMVGSKDCDEHTDQRYCYPANYSVTNPKGIRGGTLYRVVGNAFDSSENSCTAAANRAFDPDYRARQIGFRLVRISQSDVDPGIPGDNEIINPVKPIKINPKLNGPMIRSAYKGKAKKVLNYLERGADPDARYKSWTALMYAAWFGYEDIVDHLIAYKANASIKSGAYDALALALYNKHYDIKKKLEKYTGRKALRSRSGIPVLPR